MQCQKQLFVILVLVGIFSKAISQEPCSPKDAGEWPPVRPVLYPQIYEATEQDLLLNPYSSMYQSELRLHGVIDQDAPNGMILEPQGDFLIVNPAEVFKFETVSGQNIVRLIQPLDRDGPTESYDDDIEVITFTLKCSPAHNTSVEVYYDVSVLVVDKNDNPPMFINSPYETTVNELIPFGSSVITVSAVDKDSNIDGNITYSIVSNPSVVNDGSDMFNVHPLSGTITVKGHLDYESLGEGQRYYTVHVAVMDGGPDPKRSSYNYVKVHVTDGNEHAPTFVYPGCLQHKMTCLWPKYTTDMNAIVLNKELYFRGVPDVYGNDVELLAMDTDTVPSDIVFSIATTYPVGYDSYFTVETVRSGQYLRAIVKQVKQIDMSQHSIFEIFIKAEEDSAEKRYAIAMILFVGKSQTESDNPATTAMPVMKTDAQTNDKTTEEYTMTTVALIVVISVTLTLVLCLAVALACIATKRRHQSSDKAPLTQTSNGNYNSGFSAQL